MEISISDYAAKQIPPRTPQAARLHYKAGRLPGRKIAGVILVDDKTPWPADGRKKPAVKK
jgi:hypothetical protein